MQLTDVVVAASSPITFVDLAPALTGLGGGLISLLVVFLTIARSRKVRAPRPETLDARLSSVAETAQTLRLLVAEVEAEAEAQVAVAERAAAEAKKNEQLASLSESQAEAVASVFAAQGKFSTKLAIWIGAVSLVVSNVISVVVTLIVSG